jgi:hypothetical protein
MVSRGKFVVAKRMNHDLVVVLKIGKEVVGLPQSIGVRQGDKHGPRAISFPDASICRDPQDRMECDDRNPRLHSALGGRSQMSVK